MASLKEIPVLIVGGGPIGLALAIDLGLRGVDCLLVEQGDGTIRHPKANSVDVRSMEFCRRWGIADTVRARGTPGDFPYTALYCTSLNGFEICRIEHKAHGSAQPSPFSPETAQRCNQLWFDGILRERAAALAPVTLRHRCRFDAFERAGEGVIAEITDLATGAVERIAARFLIAACGGHSPIRRKLGIDMAGVPVLGYPLDILLRAKALWTHHDKGKAALHYIVGPTGVWASLTALDGRELWRLTIHGSTTYLDPTTLDPHDYVRRVIDCGAPYEVLALTPWVRRDLVAERMRYGPVFLVGDCAHQNSPSGGYGMNTGLGDVWDLGWKLEAALAGWDGERLLESFHADRRPVCARNVREATINHQRRQFTAGPEVARESAEGARIRAELAATILAQNEERWQNFGIALGYRYAGSPVCDYDGEAPADDDPDHYRPSARPGSRAPHVTLGDGRSVIDLFGRGFALLRLGADAPDPAPIAAAFARRGVPFALHLITAPDARRLYERRLILVRPDGHVAWRGDSLPADPIALVDRVRGA